jgi:hypothetical protein
MSDERGFDDRMNSLPKYVMTNTLTEGEWNATLLRGDAAAAEVATLKQDLKGTVVVPWRLRAAGAATGGSAPGRSQDQNTRVLRVDVAEHTVGKSADPGDLSRLDIVVPNRFQDGREGLVVRVADHHEAPLRSATNLLAPSGIYE